MVKRSKVTLDDIAEWKNLMLAAHRAAAGKRDRVNVAAFLADLEISLTRLQQQILSNQLQVGQFRRFFIFDPKRREICAPAFPDRVLHHALMGVIGPHLDRTLVNDSFACRVGKGSLAAVLRAQHHCRRFQWFGKLDVRKYFASVNHGILMRAIERRFKNEELLALIWQIIDCHYDGVGRGLPIGSLTSQHFANYYLCEFDHWILGQPEVRGMVRYMDDVVWWCDDRLLVNAVARSAEEFLKSKLSLQVHQPICNRSTHGLTLCGYRVFPGTIKLGLRLKQRYRESRRNWEQKLEDGLVDSIQLQQAYTSALAVTQHADSRSWRRNELVRSPWRDG